MSLNRYIVTKGNIGFKGHSFYCASLVSSSNILRTFLIIIYTVERTHFILNL